MTECTCNEHCDDTCPVHWRENSLQEQITIYRGIIKELQERVFKLKSARACIDNWRIGKTSVQGNPGDADSEHYYIYLKDGRRFYSEEEAMNAVQETWVSPLLALQKRIHEIAVEKGWYDPPPTQEQALLNMHGEISEASEALRNHNPQSEKIPGFSCVEEEMADVIIRGLDTAEYNGWRVIEAMLAKIEYNKTRPHRHGGKAY